MPTPLLPMLQDAMKAGASDILIVSGSPLAFKINGRITHVGRTSMEVRVDTFVESLGGERRQVNRAYLVMVALDPKTHKPTPVPSLLLETEEDFAEWEAGNLRAKARKARRG